MGWGWIRALSACAATIALDHFCHATIHNGTLHFQAFDHEGRLLDQLAMKKD
jgi:hypothetical protein